MKNSNPEEGRRHPRFSHRFVIRSRRRGKTTGWEDVSTITNLSVGGCLFSSRSKYEAGEVLELQIHLPVLRNPPLIVGRVKRCEKMSDTDFFLIAVSFLDLNAEVANALMQTAEFFLKKQKERS